MGVPVNGVDAVVGGGGAGGGAGVGVGVVDPASAASSAVNATPISVPSSAVPRHALVDTRR